RWPRDWSSDVCSSDLVEDPVEQHPLPVRRGQASQRGELADLGSRVDAHPGERQEVPLGVALEELDVQNGHDEHGLVVSVDRYRRSEERRVGKERIAGY